MRRPKLKERDPKLIKRIQSRLLNQKTNREPAVLHQQGGKRPRPAWRSFAIIDDDWAQLQRKRGRLKDALLTDREI